MQRGQKALLLRRSATPSRRSRIVDHRNLIASDVEPKWLKEAAEVSAEAGD
jgi:hypothetical protein